MQVGMQLYIIYVTGKWEVNESFFYWYVWLYVYVQHVCTMRSPVLNRNGHLSKILDKSAE